VLWFVWKVWRGENVTAASTRRSLRKEFVLTHPDNFCDLKGTYQHRVVATNARVGSGIPHAPHHQASRKMQKTNRCYIFTFIDEEPSEEAEKKEIANETISHLLSLMTKMKPRIEQYGKRMSSRGEYTISGLTDLSVVGN